MNKSKKEYHQYYILIKNLSEETYGTNTPLGSLWILESKITENLLLVSKYEGEEVGTLKQLEADSLQEIDYDTTHLLIAVPPPLTNRIKLIRDTTWIQEGVTISVGTNVEIYNLPGLSDGAFGTVRFKGRLPGKNGTSFGIELNPEHYGKGTTDGTFRHKRLFTCKEDCGVFVSIFRVRIAGSKCKEVRPKELEGANNVIVNDTEENFSLSNDSRLNINERVVWMSDFGPEFGSVKFVGVLPHSVDKKVIVGVEFDNPVGTGTGKYKGVQLFRAKRNYASLIPILGLLRASVYMSMMSEGESQPDITPSMEYKDFKIGSDKEQFEHKTEQNSLDILINQVHTLTSQNQNKDQASSSNPVHLTNYVSDGSKMNYTTGARPKVFSSSPLPHMSKFGNQSANVANAVNGFHIGDRVVISFGKYRPGVIKWIGILPGSKNTDQIIAGIEMDDKDTKCYTSGMFQGQQIFDCPPQKGFFFPIDKCTHENS